MKLIWQQSEINQKNTAIEKNTQSDDIDNNAGNGDAAENENRDNENNAAGA